MQISPKGQESITSMMNIGKGNGHDYGMCSECCLQQPPPPLHFSQQMSQIIDANCPSNTFINSSDSSHVIPHPLPTRTTLIYNSFILTHIDSVVFVSTNSICSYIVLTIARMPNICVPVTGAVETKRSVPPLPRITAYPGH